MPALATLAATSYKSKTYADHVQFVYVYTVEAHPKSPDPSPYNGKVWEAKYSSLSNPLTYAGRVANAKVHEANIKHKHLLLVDDLTPGKYNNPVWCTYGTCPNCSFLIRQDGVLAEVLRRTPSKVADLQTAIKKLLP